MDEQCPNCGQVIPADAPGGQCPTCLVRLALDADEGADTSAFEAAGSDPLGETIGPYRLIRKLGQGGMGLVYLAEQTAPLRRQVAVKIIRPGLDSGEVLARFESERQALALVQHPSIAAIFDADTTPEGRPYFAMEYVPGVPITTYCDQERLPVAARLELFVELCKAVQHAHEKGVIHRDLKPSNVLVMRQDARAVVKVIDFGVAKATAIRLTDRSLHTRPGLPLGTPEYMSPEQAGATGFVVDTRTDIYSLGVLLYELLAGMKPFEYRELRGAAILEMLRIIRDVEPPRLPARVSTAGEMGAEIAQRRQSNVRALARQLEGDLDWITLRALEKDPGRRYAAAVELADDVRRHLRHDPIVAGPPSYWYRARKFARRRRRGLTVGVAALALVVMLAAALWTTGWIRERQFRGQMRKDFEASFVHSGMELMDSDPLRALVYLTRALTVEEQPAHQRSQRMRIAGVWKSSPHLVHLWNHRAPLTLFDGTPATGRLVSASPSGTVRVWSVDGEATVDHELRHGPGLMAVQLSPDGVWLATADIDGTTHLWATRDGRKIGTFTHGSRIEHLAWSPDSRWLATGGLSGAARVWNRASGAHREIRHGGPISRLRFSPDSQAIATASTNGSARVWNAATGTPRTAPLPHGASIGHIVFSPAGDRLAALAVDGRAFLWNVTTGDATPTPVWSGVASPVAMAFGWEGNLLVALGRERTHVWNTTRDMAPLVTDHTGEASAAHVGPHFMAAIADSRGELTVSSLEGRRFPPIPHSTRIVGLRFLDSGRLLATATQDGFIRVWNLAHAIPGEPEVQLDEVEETHKAVSSPDGKTLAVTTKAGRAGVRVVDAATGDPRTPAVGSFNPTLEVAFSADGRLLATGSAGRSARVWDVASGEPVSSPVAHEVPVSRLLFSPDGRTVASAGRERDHSEVRVWDSRRGALRFDPLVFTGAITGLQFSDDGGTLLTMSAEPSGNISLWNAAHGRLLARATHAVTARVANSAVFGRGSASVWTAGNDGQVRLWGPDLKELTRDDGQRMVYSARVLRLSRDRLRAMVASQGSEIQISTDRPRLRTVWFTTLGNPLSKAGIYQRGILDAAFSPDGEWVVTRTGDGAARMWDARGRPLSPTLETGPSPSSVSIAPDGESWTTGGRGTFHQRLTADEHPAAALSALAEVEAGVTVSSWSDVLSSGQEIRPTSQLEERWRAATGVRSSWSDGRDLWLRYASRVAWRQEQYDTVLQLLGDLERLRPLRWIEVARRLGALAALGRWNEAIAEIEAQPGWSATSSEMVFFEAVALLHRGDQDAAAQLCRQQLSTIADKGNPDRVYWTVRACLLAPRRDLDWASVAALIDRLPPGFAHGATEATLEGAVRLRQGRRDEAMAQLRDATGETPVLAPAHGRLFLALAEAQPSRAADARQRLRTAVQPGPRPFTSYLSPWLEAEAALLRAEATRTLRHAGE